MRVREVARKFKFKQLSQSTIRSDTTMALGDGKAATVAGAVDLPMTITDGTEEAQTQTQTQTQATTADGGAVTTVQTKVAPAIEASLRKRYEFWQQKQAQASDDAMLEAAADALARLVKEAAGMGVDLKAAPAPEVVASSTAVKTGGKKGKSKGARSVAEKDAVAANLSAQAASKPAGEAKAKAATTVVKKDKTLRPCLDGCGAMVPGNFQMGHDAKLKSLLIKIERGEAPLEAVPEIVAGIVKFKKGIVEVLKDAKGTTTGTVQTWVLTHAPVKMHKRPELVLTQRET